MEESFLRSQVNAYTAILLKSPGDGFPVKLMEQVRKLFVDEGHVCLGMSHPKYGIPIRWCEDGTSCAEIRIRQVQERDDKRAVNEAALLVAQGHKCVCFMETYPRQVHWCKETPCGLPASQAKERALRDCRDCDVCEKEHCAACGRHDEDVLNEDGLCWECSVKDYKDRSEAHAYSVRNVLF